MRIVNLTDFLFGTKVGSRRPPEPEMTLIVRAAFVLRPGQPLTMPEGELPMSQGALSGDVCGDDDEDAPDDGSAEVRYPSDFADVKPAADVMLRGTCHCPGGRPVSEATVRFSVGAWSKKLRVVGPRVWIPGAAGDKASPPQPFVRMPLDYAHTFGGPACPENPVGKGMGPGELPNVEYPNKPLRSPAERVPPASFAPEHPLWARRKGQVGQAYGPPYRRERFPYYAVDFQWEHFNAAPEDQRIVGYLRGDEEVTFQNLHPAASTFSVKLPGVRLRAFVRDDRARFREVPMRLDTLFADVDGERLFLTWRGVTPVREDDLSDVRDILFAAELLADSPRNEEEYKARLDAPEAPLPSVEGFSASVAARAGAAEDARAPEPAAPKNAVSALLANKLGSLQPGAQAEAQRVLQRLLDTSFPKRAANAAGGAIQQAVSAAAQAEPAAPSFGAPSAGAAPKVPRMGMLSDVKQRVAKVASAAATNKPVRTKGAWNALFQSPGYSAVAPASAARGLNIEIGPSADLEGRDLSKRDLRGADLSGANLRGALLSRANLRGAVLRGASLEGAVLFEADATGADFTGANLTRANLSGARAEEARFHMATLDEAQAARVVLVRAIFDEASARGAVFERADLTGASCKGARFVQCVFDEAVLEDASFADADLTRSRFLAARGPRLGAEKSTLDGASFEDAKLAGSRFSRARGTKVAFLRADLPASDFRFAVLPESHFSEACVSGSSFRCADLQQTRFYRTNAEGAFFNEARLHDADFRKACLLRARLAGAMAYGMELSGAETMGMDVTNTFFGKSQVEGL